MRRAIVLGLVQGPTELAPISSSAHVAMLRARQLEDGPELAARRKSLEVAVHGGAAVAIALALAPRLRADWRRLGAARSRQRRLSTLALALAPPALAGYAFERPIEQRLGGARATAAGLALGGVAMALADRSGEQRTLTQAQPLDGLALGLAQACSLAPGVSRRGATLAAARARRFGRADADALSWLAGLPVIAGACALKGLRLRHGAHDARELRAGAAAAFVSTAASLAALERTQLSKAPLAPFCAYRIALAVALLRGRRGSA